MVEIIHLEHGQQPPSDEPFLLIQGQPGDRASVINHSRSVTQMVPEHLWSDWLAEGPALAERSGFKKVYFSTRHTT